jgi:hypothetical protein
VHLTHLDALPECRFAAASDVLDELLMSDICYPAVDSGACSLGHVQW